MSLSCLAMLGAGLLVIATLAYAREIYVAEDWDDGDDEPRRY
jgi:hypothetical protein